MTDDTPEVVRLASDLAETVRAINHATIASDGGIVYPSELGSAVAYVARAVHGLDQAVGQLARITRAMADRPDLYDDRGFDPLPTVLDAVARLGSTDFADVAAHLGAASGCLSHLGVRMPEPIPLAEALAAAEDGHIYNGMCPDGVEGWDSRDPECSGCQLLVSTAEAVALALQHPSAAAPHSVADGVTTPSGPRVDAAGRTEHHPQGVRP